MWRRRSKTIASVAHCGMPNLGKATTGTQKETGDRLQAPNGEQKEKPWNTEKKIGWKMDDADQVYAL